MLRDTLIDAAIKFGVDSQLRRARATLIPRYRHDRDETIRLRKLLLPVLREDSNCVDIGAYRGRMLAEFLKVAPHGRHIAYEPLPHLYKFLVARYPHVEVRNAAVSNEVGEKTFSYVKGTPAESGFRGRQHSGNTRTAHLSVRTETLDASLPSNYVPTLIKVDVEGAELQVFQGAIETISKYKPVIIFEHGKGGAAHYGTRPSHIYSILHDQAGLDIFDFDGNGPYTVDQLEESFELDERWDYIARPTIAGA